MPEQPYDPKAFPPPPPYSPPQVPQAPPSGYPPPSGQQYVAWPPPTPNRSWGPGRVVLVIAAGMVGLCLVGAISNAVTGKDGTSTKPTVAVSPAMVAMPDLRGQNAKVAQNYLNNLGFQNVQLGSQDDADSWVVLPENWTVWKQSMEPARVIPTNTLIVLTCTKQG